MYMSEISIIGDNITSPLGWTTKKNFASLSQGVTGLKRHYSKSLDLFHNSGIIEISQSEDLFTELGNAENFTKLEMNSILSIKNALDIADIDPTGKDVLFVFSTTKGNIDLLKHSAKAKVPRKRRFLQNMAKAITSFFGNKIKPILISNACISGVVAIITAQRILKVGDYKHIIVIACDEVTDFTLSGFNSLKALSQEPCLPFDAKRKGINLGDACGTIILSAEKKGYPIEIAGGASTNDANHISGPSRDGEGMIRAIQQSLLGTDVSEIDFVSAHGTATLFNDEMEAKALKSMNLHEVPTNSFKGYWGHTLGAAGVIECIASYHSILENTLVGSIGFSNQGTTDPVNIIRKSNKKTINAVLKTASGFGGCNASIIFKKKAI